MSLAKRHDCRMEDKYIAYALAAGLALVGCAEAPSWQFSGEGAEVARIQGERGALQIDCSGRYPYPVQWLGSGITKPSGILRTRAAVVAGGGSPTAIDFKPMLLRMEGDGVVSLVDPSDEGGNPMQLIYSTRYGASVHLRGGDLEGQASWAGGGWPSQDSAQALVDRCNTMADNPG
ncbi:MAG: hypothetical protein WBF53_13935 [Litorimonas sp.]